MLKRAIDMVAAAAGLIAMAPLLVVAAIGIRLSSAGPVLYRSQRIGCRGRTFTILKLRSMHANSCSTGSAITAHRDPRVFPLGAWLRRLKIDELPQLVNVLRGDMSLVGPRPEDPRIVAEQYGALGMETLAVRPGLTSPGTLYACMEGESLIDAADPEGSYVRKVLPRKLRLDAAYVRTASPRVDLALLVRTMWMIATRLVQTPHARHRQDAARLRREREIAHAARLVTGRAQD